METVQDFNNREIAILLWFDESPLLGCFYEQKAGLELVQTIGDQSV